MGEAPDYREQEDCPSPEACARSCDQHPPAEKDALRIATEACAASTEHSGGRGKHNAHRWGPCSDHERITREVLAVLTRPIPPDKTT